MSNSEKSADVTTVRSVERAVDLLEILMSTYEPLSLTELSDRANLHPSTTYRLLATLDKKRFVHQNEDSKHYSVGAKLNLLMADGSRPYAYLRDQVTPVLQEIAEELGENVSFSIQNGYKAMLLAQTSSGRLVDVRIQDAIQAPLHCTAVGKVMLAHLPLAEVRHVLAAAGMEPLTPHTITDAQVLEEALARVKVQGFAADMEEWVEGIRCVAVPVFSSEKKVIGAISISTPASRMIEPQQQRFVEVITHYAARLAERIARDISDQTT